MTGSGSPRWDEPDQLGLSLVLSVLAWVAANDRKAVAAAELLGAVDAMTQGWHGSAPTLVVTEELGLVTESMARECLSGSRFEAAFKEGAALTPAQAICLAVGGKHPASSGEQEAVAQAHVENILRQMGFDSRAEAVAWVVGVAP
jgi:DNA-binding CsgD family transcriptional regulator